MLFRSNPLHLFAKKNHKADYALKAQAMKTKKQAFVKVSYVKADDGVKSECLPGKDLGLAQINLW
jgi:hypothetical protein